MFSRTVESFKFIVNTMVFEGLTGCVCEQKMYQNSIQIDTQIHVKIHENQRRNYVQKRITKNSYSETIQHRVQLNTKSIQQK